MLADFDSMVTALSFIRHIYEANECPSSEAKIFLMPLMLLDSCKTTDGGAVTPVAMFHMERTQLRKDSFDIDKVALPVCFSIP